MFSYQYLAAVQNPNAPVVDYPKPGEESHEKARDRKYRDSRRLVRINQTAVRSAHNTWKNNQDGTGFKPADLGSLLEAITELNKFNDEKSAIYIDDKSVPGFSDIDLSFYKAAMKKVGLPVDHLDVPSTTDTDTTSTSLTISGPYGTITATGLDINADISKILEKMVNNPSVPYSDPESK